ncbi:Beta-1 adrenergic receptor [Holothuria leucospilota]|uniref:Beta-1 adrenergic receptor n=1 Tax=Holothuria leucospilota TaxID=206669 RepID=A0A9Q1C8S6_HOLLE|nr:Beta-1 adrenergic receptor [Holothuria leucospilota]
MDTQGNHSCHLQMQYQCPQLPPRLMVFFLLWDILIFVAILLGNTMVIASVARYSNMRSPTNILLASLATGDLFVAFVCLPVDVALGLGAIPWVNPWHCLGGALSILSVSAVSTWHMTAVTFERYLAITKPYKHQTLMSHKKVSTMIACVWVSAVLFSALGLADFGNDLPCLQEGCCDLLLAISPTLRIMSIVIGSLLPCMVMTVLYTKIIRCAQLQLKRINASEVQSNHRHNRVTGAFLKQLTHKFQRRDLKAAKTVALILGAFLLAWSPASLIAVSDIVFPSFIHSHYSVFYGLQLGLFHIAFSNSFVNPVIYCHRNRDFRLSFLKLLHWILPGKLKRQERMLENQGVITINCVANTKVENDVLGLYLSPPQ